MKKTLKVLVSEHDRDVAEGLCEILELAGHEVFRAFTPEQTRELLRLHDFHIGFVNLHIPGLSKLESFSEVRKIKPDTKLIMMSAHTIDRLTAEITDGGSVRILTAPVTPDNVMYVLGEIGPMGTMLIEDVPANLATTLQAELEERNANVGIAHDEIEGLARVAQGNIDVLLLDLRLSVLRSLEVYLRLKQQGLSSPTIIFQSYADDRTANDSISDVDFLLKPFHPALMVKLLDEMAAQEGHDTTSEAPALAEVFDIGDRAEGSSPQGAGTEFDAEPLPPRVTEPAVAEYRGPSSAETLHVASEQPSPITEIPVHADEPEDDPSETEDTSFEVEEDPSEDRLPAAIDIAAEQLEQAVTEAENTGLDHDDEAPTGGRDAPESKSEAMRVLVVDDDLDVADGLAEVLAFTGFDVRVTYSTDSALEIIEDFDVQIALVDIRLGRDSGLDLVTDLKERRPDVIVMMVTAQTEQQTAIEALRKGAFDYLNKPLHPEELLAALGRCFDELAKRALLPAASQPPKAVAADPQSASAEYLAKLSVKLGTPINTVVGFSENLSEEMLGPLGATQYGAYALDIEEASEHLSDVIEEFAGIDKSEGGKLELYDEAVDLTRIIFRCLERVQPAADAGDLTVEIELAEIPVFIIGDRYKLTQITLSLLTNAVKFTPKQGKIRFIQRRHDDGGIVIEVVDTGIGISEEVISQSLSTVIESDSQLDPDYEGSGLGLPLTASMVKLHGGEILLDSKVGAGTTATLHLPPERNIAPKRSAAV